jgi:hypothetical protein
MILIQKSEAKSGVSLPVQCARGSYYKRVLFKLSRLSNHLSPDTSLTLLSCLHAQRPHSAALEIKLFNRPISLFPPLSLQSSSSELGIYPAHFDNFNLSGSSLEAR